MSRSARLKELARLFFKLGAIGFGGPAAHIAMMEEEVSPPLGQRPSNLEKNFVLFL